MIVITLSKVPQSLRGDLTKWCQEVQVGVYVGSFSAKIRDLLWQRINKNIGSGVATMIYSTNNELGYQFRTTRCDYEVTDYDGIPLLKHLKNGTLSNSGIKHGFSNAAKYHRARIYKAKSVRKPFFSNVVSLDIETTGLDPEKNKIISIGAIKGAEGNRQTFYRLINIESPIPDAIVKLTKINDEKVKRLGVSLTEALNDLVDFIGNKNIIGYNLQFDISFLNVACQKNNLPLIKNKTVDVLPIIKKREKFLDNYRLDTVLKHYGIERKNAHNSLSDASSTLTLFCKLNENEEIEK